MSQSDNKKLTPPVNENSTSRPSEMKLEGSEKVEVQKPRASVLPPEDSSLIHMVRLSLMPEPVQKPTLLEKAKRFLARLFGQ